jgi:Spy/CpxP family protein refolding chaperone
VSATKTTLVAVVVLMLTFGAGFIAGAAVHHLIGHREGVPAFATHVLLNRLDRHLDLTDAQRRQVDAILRRRHAAINAMWAGVRPRVREELEATNAEIAKVLTPAQRAKFEKMRMHLLHQAGRGRKAPTR